MNKNCPVYDFLGYKLLSVTYSRKKTNLIDYFLIKTGEKRFDDDSKVFSFILEVSIKFKDDDISRFVFKAEFKVNDLNWKNQLNDEILESIFVSAIFPYVREKIQSLTDDSRGSIYLPIIDLRNISLSKGAKYSPVYTTSAKTTN